MDSNNCSQWFLPLVFLFYSLAGFAPPALAGPNGDPPPQSLDLDDDGLLNDDEALVGTDADNPDSDADGIRDGIDPDIVSNYVEQLPRRAFKSKGRGHRRAITTQLANNERYLLAGKVEKSIDGLWRLRRHLDGCPYSPDKNDWITDCDSQQEARRLLDILLDNHVVVAVDTSIEPPVDTIPGVNGGPERPLGVAVGRGRPTRTRWRASW
jgi:hypothetical protein